MCLNSKSLCAREPIEPNSIWRSQLDDPYFRGVPLSLSPLFLPPFHRRPEHSHPIVLPPPPPRLPLPRYLLPLASSFSPSCVHNGDTIDFEAQSIVTRSSRRKRHGSPLHRLWMAHTRSTPVAEQSPPYTRVIASFSRKSMVETPFCFWYKSPRRSNVRRKFLLSKKMTRANTCFSSVCSFIFYLSYQIYFLYLIYVNWWLKPIC